MVATAVPHVGMQQYNFGGEALHGVWASCISDNFTTPTHKPTDAWLCPTRETTFQHFNRQNSL